MIMKTIPSSTRIVHKLYKEMGSESQSEMHIRKLIISAKSSEIENRPSEEMCGIACICALTHASF